MSIHQIADFLLEIDKLKAVERKTKPAAMARYENSAEHSWQVAMMALALEPYAVESVQMDRVVRMLLVHDVGEIDAGDVIVYAEVNQAERAADELAGVQRVLGLLPAEQAAPLIALWQEFEEAQTAESRFAHALDRAMPVFLNLANNGQSWREHGVSYERVMARLQPEIEAGCPALWTYLEGRLQQARVEGWFGTSV
jgi:putative hydrolase of HD superfamily